MRPATMRWARLVVQLFGLVGKMGVMIPAYMYIRRKGISSFEKELRRMGIDSYEVKLLSDSYKDIGDLQKLARMMNSKAK